MTLLISSLARLLVSARTDLPDMVLAGRERLGERARRVLLALRGGHTRARPLTHSHTQTLTHTLAHIHTHTQSLVPPRAQGPVRKRRAAAARSRGSSAAAAAGSAASGRCCRGAAVRAFPPTRGRRPRPPAPGGGGEGHMATPGSGHAGAVGRTCARTLTRRPQVPGVPRESGREGGAFLGSQRGGVSAAPVCGSGCNNASFLRGSRLLRVEGSDSGSEVLLERVERCGPLPSRDAQARTSRLLSSSCWKTRMGGKVPGVTTKDIQPCLLNSFRHRKSLMIFISIFTGALRPFPPVISCPHYK